MRLKLLNLISIQGPSELVTLQLILPEVPLLLFTFGFVSFISLFFTEFSIESERYQDATNVLCLPKRDKIMNIQILFP